MKKQYIIPETETLVLLRPLMKDLGEASLPKHMGAPARRDPTF